MKNFFKIVFLFISFYLLGCNNLDLESVSYSRIELTGPENEIISDQINIYKDSIDISLDNVIGFSDKLYTKSDFDYKNFNSTLGNLIADIIYLSLIHI